MTPVHDAVTTSAPVAPTNPGGRLVVLQSFSRLTERSNPYLALLVRSLEPTVDVVTFSWRRALFGRWDVLHLHWPELVFRRASAWRTGVLGCLTLLVVIRARLTRRAIVRTLHNVRPHDGAGAVQRWLLRRIDLATTGWVLLNPFTTAPTDAPAAVIVHGHYRDWFEHYPVVAREPSRLVFFGLIRRYKGVEALLDAVADLGGPEVRLAIVGSVDGAELHDVVETAASADSRVELALGYATDADLAQQIYRAQLVVLPYRELHNSGAMLLALSLGRPVLVPDNAVTAALAIEVGEVWVLRYQGQLRASDISAAIIATRVMPERQPDLSAREWSLLGSQHVDLYRAARSVAAGGAR